MTTAFDLLSRGYFPKEVTPPFNTLEFANRVLGYIGVAPASFARAKRCQLCSHNFARVGRYRRVLSIPNPVAQYNLCVLIGNSWPRIEKLVRRSTITVSQPVQGKERALTPGEGRLNETRARLRATARHIVFADIARFYHSIYTHVI